MSNYQRYLNDDDDMCTSPIRFYALFSPANEDPDGSSDTEFGYFDCVLYDSFEYSSQEFKSISDFVAAGGTPAIAIWQSSIKDVLKFSRQSMAELNNQWLEIQIGDKGADGIPAQYVSLATVEGQQEEVAVVIMSIQTAPLALQQKLNLFFTPRLPRPSTEEELIEILSGVPALDIHVAVYDMGQANCNAIVDDNLHPVLFYDLGWPLQFNNHGIPKIKPNLFGCELTDYLTPVILSHWDWDHWAYAMSSWTYDYARKVPIISWNNLALNRPWIVPQPFNISKLRPTTAYFFSMLQISSYRGSPAMNMWPTKLQNINFNFATLVKCSSSTLLNENNSGLALLVKGWTRSHIDNYKAMHTGEVILLPGDADYSSIPSLYSPRPYFVGVVASHHGGKVTGYGTPLPSVPKKMAISCGYRNTYNHPNTLSLSSYHGMGWKMDETRNRRTCPNSSSYHSHSMNSILLRFPSSRPPRFNCPAVANAFLCLI